ncbi:cytochrome b5 [Lysinibacillus sphaericus]|uniref:cytochrome b5 domain-containing protein n=1 Tax=Lysinibacillus TaxID=400634 RepID=UPI0013B09DCD|nr:cytochrome b5 domain-containing protein [Lysinibacillus sphaericus]MBG9691399.1 cytochrome b5 [Lysinibacillus sphaericus]QIC49633.1 cytochrome b5 [Lysinibacillus sphaericus]
MQNIEMLRWQLNSLVSQVRQDIFTLSTINPSITPQILQRLWDTISSIHLISELLANQALNCYPPLHGNSQIIPVNNTPINTQVPPITTPQPNQSISQINGRIFTIEELANFDGKNGRAAYLAVNGIVYDVTNNRAWAAATHFGLLAGKEYSQEFASCHAGQQSILDTLPQVGRLV